MDASGGFFTGGLPARMRFGCAEAEGKVDLFDGDTGASKHRW